MSEEFLHHVWKFRLFDASALFAETGERIEVLHPGEHNLHSGPDFFNARIRINGTVWVGNVEIHIRSSDWEKHDHSRDRAYDSILLHVVYIHDTDLGKSFPTLELRSLVPKYLLTNYETLKSSKRKMACENQLSYAGEPVIRSWLNQVASARLERKANIILKKLQQQFNHWEETFYQVLAAAFGFKINTTPFELLARSLPYHLVMKHRGNLFQTEALLFGQAGFLDEPLQDAYPRSLQNEYIFLQKKFRLTPLQKHLWKTMRMHPSNFPLVRIAQLAAVLQTGSLFTPVMEAGSTARLKKLFEAEASGYWNTHYLFDRPSPFQHKKLGQKSIDSLLINAVAPLYYAYGKANRDEAYVERALDLLQELDAEQNSVSGYWQKCGFKTLNALETQGLLELVQAYCNRKKCLNCAIGNKLLGREREFGNHSLNLQHK